MREKRFKKKALSVFGIAAVLAIGVGLLTAYATSSATAQVSVTEQEGIKIGVINLSITLGPTCGFGRAYKSVNTEIFRVDPDPDGTHENADFRITITSHTSLNDAMLKLTIDNESGSNFDILNVYGEESSSGNSISDLNDNYAFYVNPGSGSTTLYVEVKDNAESTRAQDNIVITLDSVSWAKNPFDIGSSGASLDIVASGKALE